VHLAAVLEVLLPLRRQDLADRARCVRRAPAERRAVDHAAGRGLGRRRARACNCRSSGTMDLLLAPGEPASDAIRTTALMRHLVKGE
jgi:hypothetical protein